jgi:citrate lyase synthetase
MAKALPCIVSSVVFSKYFLNTQMNFPKRQREMSLEVFLQYKIAQAREHRMP